MKAPVTKYLRIALVCLPLLAAGLPRAGLAADESRYTPPPGEATSNEMMADMLVQRPLGLARTLLGTGIWIVSLPFTIFSGDVGESADKLIADPAAHTFTRPLGYSRPVTDR